ncbi:MAG: hypothetical protein KH376_11200 [Holdemanella biformis]|nr:hypothetical protein [Holdemanella biformis]MBS6456278.1 hypothetical protein [Holdemanella biformis]
MQIIYKKTAIDDLLNTENYIISRFNNKQAAQKLNVSTHLMTPFNK